MVVGFPVDNEPSYLFRKGFQSLNAIPKTKVLGHFHEWLVALVPMDRHEVSDRREQQSKPTYIKSFSLKLEANPGIKLLGIKIDKILGFQGTTGRHTE